MKQFKQFIKLVLIFIAVILLVGWPFSALFWIWTYNVLAAKACASYAVVASFFFGIYFFTEKRN